MTWTELHEACQHENATHVMSRVRSHSEEAVLVDDHGFTPLHIACLGNPPREILEALLKAYPLAASQQDRHGDTPLHIAVQNPDTNPTVVRTLLDACPTLPTIANKEGLMPLHLACRNALFDEQVIGLLVDAYPKALSKRIKMGNRAPRKFPERLGPKKAEQQHIIREVLPNSLDGRFEGLGEQIRDGAYPLHMAVAAGAPRRAVEILMEKEDYDARLKTNKFRQTPLHIALEHEAGTDIVELLVSGKGVGALSIQDKNGKTPLEVALDLGKYDEATLRLLRIDV